MATRSARAGVESVAGLLDTPPVVDAGLCETGFESLLGAVALADGAERPGIATVRRHRVEGPRGRALQRAEHLHLVADLLLPIEVEGHLTLADDGRGLDHVRGEGDVVPPEDVHPVPIMHSRRSPARLPAPGSCCRARTRCARRAAGTGSRCPRPSARPARPRRARYASGAIPRSAPSRHGAGN